jgi:hypothetical protein
MPATLPILAGSERPSNHFEHGYLGTSSQATKPVCESPNPFVANISLSRHIKNPDCSKPTAAGYQQSIHRRFGSPSSLFRAGCIGSTRFHQLVVEVKQVNQSFVI